MVKPNRSLRLSTISLPINEFVVSIILIFFFYHDVSIVMVGEGLRPFLSSFKNGNLHEMQENYLLNIGNFGVTHSCVSGVD